jgi:protein phosphatase 2C-like protein
MSRGSFVTLVVNPLPQWRVIGASARGSSHEAASLPCQDAHAWRVLADGWLVAAVADGAGSAARAELGATTAVAAAVDAVAARLPPRLLELGHAPAAWDPFLREILTTSLEAVGAVRTSTSCELRDLASTLLVAIIGPDRVAVAQIGDGAVVYRSSDATIRVITSPGTPSEYINEATFLISRDAIAKASVAVIEERPRQLALFSDGLQLVALRYPSWDPHEPFFTPLFDFVSQSSDTSAAQVELAAYLGSTALRDRSSDDITLVLVGEASCT